MKRVVTHATILFVLPAAGFQRGQVRVSTEASPRYIPLSLGLEHLLIQDQLYQTICLWTGKAYGLWEEQGRSSMQRQKGATLPQTAQRRRSSPCLTPTYDVILLVPSRRSSPFLSLAWCDNSSCCCLKCDAPGPPLQLAKCLSSPVDMFKNLCKYKAN